MRHKQTHFPNAELIKYMKSKQFTIRSLLILTMITAVSLPYAVQYYPTVVEHLFPPEHGVAVPDNTNPAIRRHVKHVNKRIDIAVEERWEIWSIDQIPQPKIVQTPPAE